MVKIAIAFSEEIGKGLLANAAACIASGLFYEGQGLVGEKIDGKDFEFIPITKIPILVLRQGSKTFGELLTRAKRCRLKYMVFTAEGQSTTSYEEYAMRVRGKAIEDLNVIGIGVIGEDSDVRKFSGDLALLR